MEIIIIIAIVGVCAAYLVRQILRAKDAPRCGCGCSADCPSAASGCSQTSGCAGQGAGLEPLSPQSSDNPAPRG